MSNHNRPIAWVALGIFFVGFLTLVSVLATANGIVYDVLLGVGMILTIIGTILYAVWLDIFE